MADSSFCISSIIAFLSSSDKSFWASRLLSPRSNISSLYSLHVYLDLFLMEFILFDYPTVIKLGLGKATSKGLSKAYLMSRPDDRCAYGRPLDGGKTSRVSSDFLIIAQLYHQR